MASMKALVVQAIQRQETLLSFAGLAVVRQRYAFILRIVSHTTGDSGRLL
jgi:hypothetical protein